MEEDIGSLNNLYSILFCPPTENSPIFVAVDFERTQVILANFQPDCLGTQAGVSILDTRHLDRQESNISSFNFITPGTKDDTYKTRSARAFHFGTAEIISNHEMSSKIRHCLDGFHHRRIVLVGHGISSDLAVLRSLDFFEHTNITAKLDTVLLARNLQLGHPKLRDLLVELQCPVHFRFHNAGNDANFALRAVLLLGRKMVIDTTPIQFLRNYNDVRSRADLLQFISIKDIIGRNRKKLLKKRHARPRSLAEQEEIREARRQKKEQISLADLPPTTGK